ncbi:peptidoglycan-binding domain-containing protein [Streptomyces sp. NPDC049099]|uniref:peptidoglycan-binding domain-containing protein n=1 Tax=Streptomyces sp. NPDC049099 TaxID=3155768 RepID=UPI00342304D5
MTDSGSPGGRICPCPECGAPRVPAHGPSCDCTERAAETLRETRSAEAAAAEDFDPLRIRPYVEVDGAHTAPAAPGTPSGTETQPVPAVEATLPLPQTAGPNPADVRMFGVEGAGGASGAPRSQGGTGGAGADGVHRAQGAGTGRIDAPGAAEPLGAGAGRRRSRRGVLLSVAGAGVAVVAAAGFASGLFSYHTPSRHPAADEVRESVPDVSTPGPASPTAPSSPAVPRSPAPSPSASVSRPSPSATPSPSPTPSASAETSHPASPTAPMTAAATPRTTPAVTPVLQRGDSGPEVAELQQRLRQVNLYADRITGIFTRSVEDAVRTYQLARGIQGDALGVYGPATRRSLEAETSGPSDSISPSAT